MFIQPKDFSTLQKLTEPRLSVDERFVSYTYRRPDGDRGYEQGIRVLETASGEVVTTLRDRPITAGARWNPRKPTQFAYVVGTDGAKLQVAEPHQSPTTLLTGVDTIEDPIWSPDGQTLAFVMRSTDAERERGLDVHPGSYTRPDQDPQVVDRLVYRTETGEYLRGHRRIYTVDVSDSTVSCVSAGGVDCYSPTWDDTGSLYWLETMPDALDNRHDIVRMHQEGNSVDCLTTFCTLEPTLVARGDGWIAHLRRDPPRESLQQIEVDVIRGDTGDVVASTAELDRTIAARQKRPLQWGARGDLYFLCPDEGRITLRRTTDSILEQSAVTVTELDVYEFDVGEKVTVFVGGSWHNPAEVYATSPDGVQRLTNENDAAIADRTVVEPEEIWFESDEGVAIQGWILTPPGFDPDRRYPAIVQIHGGPHYMWTANGCGRRWHEFQTFAAAGYVVCWCNPRGSTGYGQEHMTAIAGDWGGPDYRDIMAAVDTLEERSFVDSRNVFLAGGSYGGYLAAWCIGHSDRFRAAAIGRGGHDRISYYGTSSTGFKTSIEDEFDALPWRDHELLWDRSPAAHVDGITTPTLLLHGDEDFLVPIGGSEILYRFLKRLGTETRLIRYPGEGHGFPWNGEPGHVIDRYHRILEWFDEHRYGDSSAR